MLPPPAPIDTTSIEGKSIGVPHSTTRGLVHLGWPSMIAHTSALVPPISIPTRLLLEVDLEIPLTATAPPAGPDRNNFAGMDLAALAVHTPPLDCMIIRSLLNPHVCSHSSKRIRCRSIYGATKALAVAVLVRSNSRISWVSSADAVTCTLGRAS